MNQIENLIIRTRYTGRVIFPDREAVYYLHLGRGEKDVCEICTKDISYIKNYALKTVKAPLALISSYELIFEDHHLKYIKSLFDTHENIDIVLVQIKGVRGRTVYSYFPEKKAIELNDLQFLTEFEICFRPNRIRNKQLRFNRLFAQDGKFAHWENKVFVADALKAGLKVLLVPEILQMYYTSLIIPVTSQLRNYKGLGAALCHIYGLKYIHQYIDLSVRKLQKPGVDSKQSEMSLYKLELMLQGAYEYMKN